MALVPADCKTGDSVKKTATGAQTIALANGQTLTVTDHSGNKVFELRDDGTVHIKTGQTVNANL